MSNIPNYDIDGNVLEDGGDGGSVIPSTSFEETSKATWADMAYNTFISSVYEPMRSANPSYITREVIGRDASDTYDMYLYTFEPDYPEQTIWLQSGMHGREKDGYISLAILLQHIVNDWRSHEGLAYLRWKCRICVIPVMNPWGADHNSDNNANGVNLNGNNYSASEAETQANHAAFESVLQTYGVSFCIDYHTTVNNSYGDYMASVKPGAPNETLVKNLVWSLAWINVNRRTQEYITERSLTPGVPNINHLGDSQSIYTYCSWWYTVKGVPSATIEHSDYVWSIYQHTAAAITRAVENFANELMAHALAKYPAVYAAEEAQS